MYSVNDPVVLLLYAGLALKMAGFFFRNEAWLRTLVFLGLLADTLFALLVAPPLWTNVYAGGILAAINAGVLLVLFFERTRFGMSKQERELFVHFPTLTPGEFRRVAQDVQVAVHDTPTTLVRQNEMVDALFLVLSDRFEVEKSGVSIDVAGPAFVGEIALLTGAPSSASVHVPAGVRVARFDHSVLRQAMRRSRGLSNAVTALFGQDLARKVAAAVPLPPG